MGELLQFAFCVFFWFAVIAVPLWLIFSIHRALKSQYESGEDAMPLWPRPSRGMKIAADEEGVTYTSTEGDASLSFRWDDVEEIRTYKLDLWAVDEICLAFLVDGRWHVLSEDDKHFMKAARAMEVHFTTIPQRWYSEVMVPAFAPNLRTLWRRGAPLVDESQTDAS